MSELASVGFDTFAFVFQEAGTYVFSSSCDAASIIVLAVMQEDVRSVNCTRLRPTAVVLVRIGQTWAGGRASPGNYVFSCESFTLD